MIADAYTLDEFLKELAGPPGQAAPCHVHKRRVRYEVDRLHLRGVTDVVADGVSRRDVRRRVRGRGRAVAASSARSGSANYVNTAYPLGLARLIDGVPTRYAVIDAGTNSIKFHVAERAGGGWRTLVDRAELTRLGEGLEDGRRIGRAPLERTRDRDRRHGRARRRRARRRHRRGRDRRPPDRQQRRRRSSHAIARATGVRIEVIPGDEEGASGLSRRPGRAGARPGAARGVRHRRREQPVDVRPRGVVDERFSVDVGAVRYTERVRARRRSVARGPRAGAGRHLDRPVPARRPRPARRAGRDGRGRHEHHRREASPRRPTTPTSSRAPSSTAPRSIARSSSTGRRTRPARRIIVGLQPKRADVILAGACVVRTVMDKLGAERAHRQRPRPPARRPRGAVRRHTDTQRGEDATASNERP